jgi:hypothetical protein
MTARTKGTEKHFTGAGLERALKDDSLTRPGVALVGMVKVSEKDGHVRFTGAGCDAWVDLPIDMIEQAEHLGQTACKDHSHAVMRITVKESNDPEAQIYRALLTQLVSTAAQTGPVSPVGWPGPDLQNRVRVQGEGPYGGSLAGVRGGGGMPSVTNPLAQTAFRSGGGGHSRLILLELQSDLRVVLRNGAMHPVYLAILRDRRTDLV